MKYFLSIVAIFKNEESILHEWIEHYLMEGVNHFYLIDNNSTDNYQKILEPYLQDGSVELNIDNRPHMQEVHYNSYYLQKIKNESEWVIVVDLDEFIYSRGSFKTITEYLKTLTENISQIYVPWKLFGSCGLIEQPKSCIDSFMMRTLYNHVKTNGMINNDRILTKTVIRTKYLVKMSLHFSITVAGTKEITSDGQLIPNKKEHQYIDEQILKHSMLHCNHYPIQSFDWFRRIKMTRGSANTTVNDKVRTVDYYNSFDLHSNQINDNELSLKRNIVRAYYGIETYIDVTRIMYQHFTNQSLKKIIIDENIMFNNYFGDPVPSKEKYLIIRQRNRLKIYPENNHGKIVIDVN